MITGKTPPKSFRIELDVPNEDGSMCCNKIVTIKMSPVTKHHTTTFSYSIPDYVQKKVEGCGVDAPKDYKTYDKLKVKQDANSLRALIYNVELIFKTYIYLLKIEKQGKNKVIYIKYDGDLSNCETKWDHSPMGRKFDMLFHFFVGFRTKHPHDNDKYLDYHTNMRPLKSGHSTTESGIFISHYDVIKWTQEREDYLIAVMAHFKQLDDRLKDYLEDIDETKIKELMAAGRLLTG